MSAAARSLWAYLDSLAPAAEPATPTADSTTLTDCEDCRGTGHGRSEDFRCSSCHGTGRAIADSVHEDWYQDDY